MSVPHWHAGWNMPGYLPEMEPAAFHDHESAKRFLIEELDRAGDHFASVHPRDDAEAQAIANELTEAMEDLNLISDGEEWSTFPIGNCVYWLTFSAESFTCSDECEVTA